jgi:hypothetical protein
MMTMIMELRIGCHSVPQYAPQFVADALGLYRKFGLDVSYVATRLGFGAVNALFDGEIDMLLGNGMYTLLCAGTAREMRIVGDLVLRSYLVLATRAGNGDSEWPVLAGKQVLVAGTNPASWLALLGTLAADGLTPTDLRVLPCLSVEDAVDLHRVGVGDYVLLPLEASVHAGLHVAASLAGRLGPVPWSVYQIPAHQSVELEPRVRAFRQALGEALDWCAHHSATEIAALTDEHFADLGMIDAYKRADLWARVPGPDGEAIERWQGIMQTGLPDHA